MQFVRKTLMIQEAHNALMTVCIKEMIFSHGSEIAFVKQHEDQTTY